MAHTTCRMLDDAGVMLFLPETDQQTHSATYRCSTPVISFILCSARSMLGNRAGQTAKHTSPQHAVVEIKLAYSMPVNDIFPSQDVLEVQCCILLVPPDTFQAVT